MADLRLQHDEDVVGAGHATKEDTANRLALAEADIDGKGKARYLKEQASDPATLAGEVAHYSKRVGDDLEAFLRGESNATPLQMTTGGCADLLAGMKITAIQSGTLSGTMAAYYGETHDIAISAVEISKSFVVLTGGPVGSSRAMVSARLNCTTNLRIEVQNMDNTYSQFQINWMVVTALNISVQTGMLTCAVSNGTMDTSQTATIAAVDMSKAFVLNQGCHRSSPSGLGWAVWSSYKISNATTLAFVLCNLHNSISVTFNVPWQVIELNN